MRNGLVRLHVSMAILALGAATGFGQAVDVTVQLDATTLSPGQSTTLRVFAAVKPALAAQSDRIFSWYIDVVPNSSLAATARYSELTMATSDNIPAFSSSGSSYGSSRRGIHNLKSMVPDISLGMPVGLLGGFF